MTDEPFYTPGKKPPAPRQAKPGELLFEFYAELRRKTYRCELRDHGKYGIEAQFLDPVDLAISHRFETREEAIAWAEQTRRVFESGNDE